LGAGGRRFDPGRPDHSFECETKRADYTSTKSAIMSTRFDSPLSLLNRKTLGPIFGRKSMKRILLAVLCLAPSVLLGQSKAWALEPATYRDIPWGATKEQAKAILDPTIDCRPWQHMAVAEECYGTVYRIGSVEIYDSLTFYQGRLAGAHLLQNRPADLPGRRSAVAFEDKFDELKRAFIAMYGEPATRRINESRNADGTPLGPPSEMMRWHGKTVRLILNRTLADFSTKNLDDAVAGSLHHE
jgi:hypothetical protein